MIALIVGGLLTGAFGLATTFLNPDHPPPRWLSWGTFAAGLIVLAAGFWVGIDQNKSTTKIHNQGKQIIDLASELKHWTTGADSFCYYHYGNFAASPKNKILRMLVHVGRYPIYEISVDITDATTLKHLVNAGDLTFDSLRTIKTREHLGTVHPNDIAQNMYSKACHFQGDLLPVTIPQDTQRQEYSILFSARNGIWVQDIIIERVSDRCVVAYRVRTTNPEKILLEHIDANFPRDADNSIEWENSTNTSTAP